MANHKVEQLIHIPVDGVMLEGMLIIPEGAKGIVVFAHGSGSSRHSPRNNFVAKVLHAGGLGTLLIDLLTPAEESVYETRFDIGLLTVRLVGTTTWLTSQPQTENAALGYFGASTGAAAALQAAAVLEGAAGAVVSRGGRPDLAGSPALQQVEAPTLFIVGGEDHGVIELNQQAYEELKCPKEFRIIPGATHLFEEEGTLEEVAKLSTQWFQQHLQK